LIADQLGTANTTVELGGTQTVTRRAFKPYGETRGPKPSTWPNKRSYLGVGIDDATTGLTHIGAREYDQAAGRFLSADPVIDISEPLQMNGYAYAGNSPISTSDPTGLCPADICGTGSANPSQHYGGGGTKSTTGGGDGGGGGGGGSGSNTSGTTTTVTYTTTKTVTVTKPAPCDWWCKAKGWMKKHVTVITIVTEVVVGVTCGAVAVGVGAATAGAGAVAVGAACGAIAGAAAGAVGNALDPEADHSLGGYASAAGKGAAVGAVASVIGGAVAKAAAKGAKAVASKVLGKTGGTKAGTAQCFLAGTPILLADGTTKNIEDIQVGDKVLSTNPTTGETNAQPVTELLPSEGDKKLNELTITTADGNQKITGTAEHPFWIPKANAWINAADLKPGTTLSTPNGTTAKIANNRPYTDHVRTYNFAVANLHTYYVLAGTTPVLVHNTCKVVKENQGGRFGDLDPGIPGDGLTPHHMPQDALHHLPRPDGGAVVMKQADHELTRTYGGRGGGTKRRDAGLPFRTVLAMDIWDMRRIGQQQYNDPGYFNTGILEMMAYYRSIGQI
ncbi:polymorphic toxin-type HINT domain-containing protein, partial [Streptomyces sp. NPDC102274]|uniref:polymorphic toxin-type HINT domain-containing protein n=1 Tax=Streptomyces sp. NPDC102274 TaxID=3366151 RepID=UPI003821A522